MRLLTQGNYATIFLLETLEKLADMKIRISLLQHT